MSLPTRKKERSVISPEPALHASLSASGSAFCRTCFLCKGCRSAFGTPLPSKQTGRLCDSRSKGWHRPFASEMAGYIRWPTCETSIAFYGSGAANESSRFPPLSGARIVPGSAIFSSFSISCSACIGVAVEFVITVTWAVLIFLGSMIQTQNSSGHGPVCELARACRADSP